MVEAPEKIWADLNIGIWLETPQPNRRGGPPTEYTRSDIAERQIAELRAQLATAYQVKAECNDEANRERHLRIAAEARESRLSEALEKGRKNVAAVMKALMATGSRDNLLLADAVHKADDSARAALSGSDRRVPPRSREEEGGRLMSWTEQENKRKRTIEQMETSSLIRLIFIGLSRGEYRFDQFWAEAELNRRLPVLPEKEKTDE